MGTPTLHWGFTSVPVPPDFQYPATVPVTENNQRKRLWRVSLIDCLSYPV